MQHHSSQQTDHYAMRRYAATRCVRLRMQRDRALVRFHVSYGPDAFMRTTLGTIEFAEWLARSERYDGEYTKYLATYGTPPPSTRYGLGLA